MQNEPLGVALGASSLVGTSLRGPHWDESGAEADARATMLQNDPERYHAIARTRTQLAAM